MIATTEVRARLDAVIASMKAAGVWEVERPADAALSDMGAFGTRSMALEQWLRYVFVPNVEALIASHGPWPQSSSVATQAYREWQMHDARDEVVPLIEALRRFDALFEAPCAEEAYVDSSAAFARGDHATALAAIYDALAVEPSFPNAHNFAGWILLHTTPPRLDEAIVHFRAAVELAPDDTTPIANLCDALVAAGRDADAIAEAERVAAGYHAGGHYWLGWRQMQVAETLEPAIVHLRTAVSLRPRWGLARVTLGKALEVAHHGDEAYEQLAAALDNNGDDFDRAFCYERIGAYQARHGWMRNALGSMRAALREDEQRGGARREAYRDGIVWIEQQLRANGVEPVPADHEPNAAWRRACELEIPPGFLAKNEIGEPLADDVVEVERLVRAARWSDVVAQLEALIPRGKLFDAVGFAERGAELARRAGATAEASAIAKLVVRGYEDYAAGASSGAEGTARMADVERVRARLNAHE